MQFTFELDIHAIVAQATAPEKIQPLLDKAITDAISSAIREATGYRSEFATKLQAQMKEALPHGLAISDVAKFQHVFNQAIHSAVEGANAETIRAALNDVVSSFMPDAPQSIKLSELLDLARKGFHKEKHEGFFAELNQSSGGFSHIYLDDDQDTSRYSAAFQIDINRDGHAYCMKFDGEKLKKGAKPNVITHFESVLMCLHTGRTHLVVDISDRAVKAAAQGS